MPTQATGPWRPALTWAHHLASCLATCVRIDTLPACPATALFFCRCASWRVPLPWTAQSMPMQPSGCGTRRPPCWSCSGGRQKRRSRSSTSRCEAGWPSAGVRVVLSAARLGGASKPPPILTSPQPHNLLFSLLPQTSWLNNSVDEDLGDQEALEAELERELAAAEEGEEEAAAAPTPATGKKKVG